MGTKVAEIVDSKCEAPGKRPNFAREFKRQLVEQTLEPGASVSLVARRNDINTNLLFRWRRQYLQGAFGAPRPGPARQEPDGDVASLLPVSIVPEAEALFAVPNRYDGTVHSLLKTAPVDNSPRPSWYKASSGDAGPARAGEEVSQAPLLLCTRKCP
ncbi:transposase [Caballeronia catudaia]|uniref:transposase n=1 Tax=Caballeronia catudaia TaxID=1777136 RepID=UPI000B35BA2B|nr:transposase [Caballeronia catudaia]